MQHKQEIERLNGVLREEDSVYQDEFLAAQHRFLDAEVLLVITLVTLHTEVLYTEVEVWL